MHQGTGKSMSRVMEISRKPDAHATPASYGKFDIEPGDRSAPSPGLHRTICRFPHSGFRKSRRVIIKYAGLLPS